jgi:hypothetical protein
MKCIISLLLFFSLQAFGCPDLKGEWKSNHELTMAYTKSYAKMPKHTYEFLNQIMGTQSVIYTKDEITLKDIEKRKIKIKGEIHDWHGGNETAKYANLGCIDNFISLRYTVYDTDFISLLNFVDNDTYWVYTGSPLVGDALNTREYFKRVK